MRHSSVMDWVNEKKHPLQEGSPAWIERANEDLRRNEYGKIIRTLAAMVEGPGHLYDLQVVYEQNRRHLQPYNFDFHRLLYELGNPELSGDMFMIGMTLFAPLVSRAANIVLIGMKAELEERDRKYREEADEKWRLHQEKLGDMERINWGTSRYSVQQLWVASKREYLEYAAQYELQQYHPSGYGTRVGEIKEGTGQYAGKFVCDFYRSTSSD